LHTGQTNISSKSGEIAIRLSPVGRSVGTLAEGAPNGQPGMKEFPGTILSCIEKREWLRIGDGASGMPMGEPMNRMKKIGAFFAVYFLLVGCEAGKKPAESASKQQSLNLTGTQWTLEEIGGKPVIEHSKASLAFLEAGRVSGNGSCNRFMGPAEVNGDKIKLGPPAGTKMMCDPGASNQETAYLKALESTERFEVKDGKLLIYVAGSDVPLRFHAAAGGKK